MHKNPFGALTVQFSRIQINFPLFPFSAVDLTVDLVGVTPSQTEQRTNPLPTFFFQKRNDAVRERYYVGSVIISPLFTGSNY